MIRNCIVCGKEFDTTTAGRRKYCSFECYYSRHQELNKRNYSLKQRETEGNITATCPVCGKSFTQRKYTQIYCSPECSHSNDLKRRRELYNKDKQPQDKVCPVCGKKFSTTNSSKVYCSEECYHSNNNKRSKLHKKITNSTTEKKKKVSEKQKILNAKKAAEEGHKLRMQRQAEAKKLGLTYGQYLARKGLLEL